MSKEQSLEDWLSEVEREVDAALIRAPPDFRTLLEKLPSIDPLVVRDTLLHRSEQGSTRAATLIASASDDGDEPAPSPRPIAHPLEYDWRFTAASAAKLVDAVARMTREGDTVGYLGAPVVFALAGKRLPRRHHVLLDRSTRWPQPTSGRDRIISVDLLRDPLPALKLDAAVLDPPWYPEYHDAFLWTAASLLRLQGPAFVSFPPLMMRPGVAAERAGILRRSMAAGLVVEHAEPRAMRYSTPPFERAGFAAAGLRAIPDDWRRGDMLILRRTDTATAERPSPPSGEPEWTFVEIDDIPLALREVGVGATTLAAPLLEAAVPGAVLPTVSRRDPARADAVLWSSRNRVYRSAAPAILQALVRSLVSAGDAVALAEKALDRRMTAAETEKLVIAANDLRVLIRTERQEHRLG